MPICSEVVAFAGRYPTGMNALQISIKSHLQIGKVRSLIGSYVPDSRDDKKPIRI